MQRVCAKNGVVYYCSEIIPCIHGFSTRIGGVSRLPHTESLNLGVERGDSKEIVLENLSLFSDALGVDAKSIISVSQIHSSNIRRVTYENKGEGFYIDEKESCDGYVTAESDITLGIRTADCVPILFYAPPSGDFDGAVAAIHAGWRGTALGIAKKAIDELCLIGAEVSNIKAAIGPSIGSCCYTVRSDFYESFKNTAGQTLTDEFVLPVGEDRWVADLKGANRRILEERGVLPENIDICDICTCCEPKEFYSHRYSHGVRGTMLSVITKLRRVYE